jgi:hypothetical protein
MALVVVGALGAGAVGVADAEALDAEAAGLVVDVGALDAGTLDAGAPAVVGVVGCAAGTPTLMMICPGVAGAEEGAASVVAAAGDDATGAPVELGGCAVELPGAGVLQLLALDGAG